MQQAIEANHLEKAHSNMSSTRLDELRASGTTVIADTADFQSSCPLSFVLHVRGSWAEAKTRPTGIAVFKPSEGTTNPSLIYTAASDPAYEPLISKTVAYVKGLDSTLNHDERLSLAVEFLSVQFGVQIYQLTGRISTEVDVALSFDTKGTVAAALRVLDLYAAEGVPREKVRIKISATWEGIQATKILQQKYGASCLVTVVFGLVQAIAAAEAGADAIAPYVGRIADYGQLHGHQGDLGIERVSDIQNYLRKYGFTTQVMAASFRNIEQVRALAGVGLLTAAPSILELVEADERSIAPVLTAQSGNFFRNTRILCRPHCADLSESSSST